MTPEPNHDSKLTYKIIGLAMRVHRTLGPGLLESVYRRCLCHELRLANIPVEQEVYLPIRYNGIDIESGYRADIIVRDEVLLELKAVENLGRLHEAQLLTYLRISRCRLGLLMNFNTLSLAVRRRAL
jgi:GxxExxY protein